MWSHFRPQSPWTLQPARVQCWNSSVGERAGLGAVQSAEFLYRSTLCCCPRCKQLGSAGLAASLTHCLLTRRETLRGARARWYRDCTREAHQQLNMFYLWLCVLYLKCCCGNILLIKFILYFHLIMWQWSNWKIMSWENDLTVWAYGTGTQCHQAKIRCSLILLLINVKD